VKFFLVRLKRIQIPQPHVRNGIEAWTPPGIYSDNSQADRQALKSSSVAFYGAGHGKRLLLRLAFSWRQSQMQKKA
jgi:hypothetical protein